MVLILKKNSTLICTGSTNIEEFTYNKELIKIVDQLGREVKGSKNSPLSTFLMMEQQKRE